jgi:hemoglobin/transferrin/lactoferrin receptor protein
MATSAMHQFSTTLTDVTLGGLRRHTLTYGIDAFHDHQEGTRNGRPRPGFPKAEQTIIGLYAQNQIAFGPLTVPLGFRFDHYDHYDQSAEGQRSRSESRLSPKASVAWQVTDWLASYVAYTEAFRAPTLTERFMSGVHFPLGRGRFNFFVPNPDLKPEVARNTEAGVNLRFRDVLAPRDSLRARLSVFQADFDDFIETIITNPPRAHGRTEARNVTRARIRGVEFEAGYDSGRWFASFGASLLRGDNFTENRPLNLIPAHKAALTVGHRFLEHGIILGGRVLAVATQDRKPFSPYPTSGYGLVDLFASWEPAEGPLVGWRLDLAVDNLLDHAHRRLSWDSGAVPADFYDVGRNIKIALRAQF